MQAEVATAPKTNFFVKKQLFPAILLFTLLCIPVLLFAGAGGSIAKALTTSIWGKILIGIVIILFLPLIIYAYLKEKIAVRRTMKDLAVLSQRHPAFDYFHLKSRATDIFLRVQHSWDKNQIEDASEWMDDWYWQNQKLMHLEKWENKGLVNKVEVKKVKSVKPLFVKWSDQAGAENSIIVVSINANMQDYLYQKNNGMVVEGDKGFKDVETVWTLVLRKGKWVVQNIEEDITSLDYAKMVNVTASKPAPQYG